MKRNYLSYPILLLFFLTSFILNAQVTNKSITGQNFSGEIVINANTSAIWSILTSSNDFFELMNFKYLDGVQKFEKIGDFSRIEDWGEPGVFILTGLKENVELRYVLEPENGSYICSERWSLNQSGTSTTVSFELRYTESGKQTEESIHEQVEHYNNLLVRLKRKAEY